MKKLVFLLYFLPIVCQAQFLPGPNVITVYRDTVIDSIKYNAIVYNQQKIGNQLHKNIIGFYTVLKPATSQETKMNFTGPIRILYADGKLHQQGNLKNGYEEGIWTFYYPDGIKKEEGEYEIVIDKGMVHDANGDIPYETTKSKKIENTWKYYDQFGNQISISRYKIIQNENSMREKIRIADLNAFRKDTTGKADAEYYKTVYEYLYPNHVFWNKDIHSVKQETIETEETVKPSLNFGWCKIEFSEYYISTDNIYPEDSYQQNIKLESGLLPDGTTFRLISDSLKNIQVYQYYESCISFLPGGSHHIDLREYKRSRSYRKLSPELNDGLYYFEQFSESSQGFSSFPKVSKTELQQKIKEMAGEGFDEEIKKVSGPNGAYCKVIPCSYFIEISGEHKITGKECKILLEIKIPMGC
jgi:antitoxin component YwqK of YwqJK toxin-antitoxin module